MKKSILICFALLFIGNVMYASDADTTSTTKRRVFRGFSLGVAGGTDFANTPSFNTEGFFQVNLNFGGYPFEPKLGYSYNSFDIDYKGINDLNVNSFGVFLEASIYPFRKYLYTGVRWELVNINVFSNSAINKMENSYMYYESVPTVFPGTTFYAVLGFDIPLSKWLNFRVYGMPGVQFYSIGETYYYNNYYYETDYTYDSYARFIFQVNACLTIRIYNRK